MSSGIIFRAFEVKVKFLWLVSRCNFYLTQKHDSVFICTDPKSFRSEPACFDFPSNLNYYSKNHNLEINLFYFDLFWNLVLRENQNMLVLIWMTQNQYRKTCFSVRSKLNYGPSHKILIFTLKAQKYDPTWHLKCFFVLEINLFYFDKFWNSISDFCIQMLFLIKVAFRKL